MAEPSFHLQSTVSLDQTTAKPAPDGSEIRELLSLRAGGVALCTLPPGATSSAARHQTVEEIWYFIEGQGEVWRRLGVWEEAVVVEPGTCLAIPAGTHFQFRNTGRRPLVFLITTMPPWPGADEAIAVSGPWAGNALRRGAAWRRYLRKLGARFRRAQHREDAGPIHEAGGIVYRETDDGPRYLLVTAKRDGKEWIFPKGHINPGETPPVAALREVREEAGVQARVVVRVGDVPFRAMTTECGREVCRSFAVEYYLMEYLGEAEGEPGRQRHWCTYVEALRELTYPGPRDLLQHAHAFVCQPTCLSSDSIQFVQKEYEHLSRSLLENEAMGERRLGHFLTIAGIVLGAFGLKEGLPKAAASGSAMDGYALVALVALLVLGLLTLVRLAHRNVVTTRYTGHLDAIRKGALRRDAQLRQECLPFFGKLVPPRREKKWSELLSLCKGGLVECIAVVNSMTAAALAGLAARSLAPKPPSLPWLAGAAALALAWVGQFWYVRWRYRREPAG